MRGHALRRQLFLIAVAAILPLAILTAAGLYFLYTQQRDAGQARTLETARALASAIDSELKRTVAGLQVMAAGLEQDGLDFRAFDDLAARTLARQPQWRNVIIADPTGRQVAHSEFPRGTLIPANPEPASVRKVVETGQPAVGGLVRGRHGFAFGVRVPLTRDGQVAYVLTAVLTPDPIRDIVMRQKASDDWAISVFDADGRRVARSKNHEKLLGTRGSDSLVALMQSGAEGVGVTTTVEGDEVFTAFARIPDSGWTVVMGLPPALITTPALRSTSVYAVAVLLSILAGLSVALFYARRFEAREEQFRAKDQFLALLGHELRNPIAAISNATHLLEMGERNPEVAHRARDIIKRQVAHLARLADDLLDAARAILGKIELKGEPVDLATAARNALASLAASGRGTRHEITHELAPAWIRGDAVRMEQVITNLLINAVKYTAAGGHIAVATGVDGDAAFVRVSDDGAGMSAELAARAFDLFVQGPRDIDRSQGGLGIGLTLVRKLADLHGGTATVASAGEGRGSTFEVRIPAVEAPQATALAAPRRAVRALTVLVVEDNDDARETLQALLEMQGHRVETARDGVTGLEKALAIAPDVAIVDLGLPGMDGFEVARRMRAASLLSNTYIVALTGYGTAEDRARALAAGFDEHLAKPVAPERLQELLEQQGAATPV